MMKNLVKNSKIGLAVLALLSVVIGGLVTYAALTVNSSRVVNLKFEDWKADKINNDLDATDWDELMDTLASMKSKIAVLEAASDVPKGAIMAFYLEECPEGWTRFGSGNGKFLRGMGYSDTLGGRGGKWEIKLYANQLPAHSHYLRYAETSNSFADSSSIGSPKDSVIVDWYTRGFPARQWQDNIVMKYIDNKYCESQIHGSCSYSYHDVSTSEYGKYNVKLDYITNPPKETHQDWWGGDSRANVDITNPYVMVLFCIKE